MKIIASVDNYKKECEFTQRLLEDVLSRKVYYCEIKYMEKNNEGHWYSELKIFDHIYHATTFLMGKLNHYTLAHSIEKDWGLFSNVETIIKRDEFKDLFSIKETSTVLSCSEYDIGRIKKQIEREILSNTNFINDVKEEFRKEIHLIIDENIKPRNGLKPIFM